MLRPSNGFGLRGEAGGQDRLARACVQTGSRSEPVFFNGHHYRVDYSFNRTLDAFDVKVKGTSRIMRVGDRKPAIEIATSAVRHFACPQGMSGALAGEPAFAAGTWTLQARCA